MVRSRFSFLDHAGPVAFAHRGGAKEREENTWAAFSHAYELGYRYLETDVHATADGVVAVIHDPVLDRVTDRSGLVGDLPWSEVAAARTAGGEAVPRLDEVLAAWPDVRFNIDAKHEAVVGPLLDVLRRADAVGRVCVTSFSDGRIGRLREGAGPALCSGTGPRGIAALRLATAAGPLGPTLAGPLARTWRDAGATQVPVRWGALPVVDRRFVDGAHARGLAVHVWTIDDEAQMVRLLDLGVDGIMTDRPSLLRKVLVRRGEWAAPTD